MLAEFLIVITRFVFSYEQAYMGDVVRFWYAALFLFASASPWSKRDTCVSMCCTRDSNGVERHSSTPSAVSFLGIPICWVILMHGMGGKGNSINSPLLSFEVSQSGYGMYVKYIMAGFLIIFAVSMLIQFVSFLLFNIAQLNEPDDDRRASNLPAIDR